jgi:S1-C subfamily serine protease
MWLFVKAGGGSGRTVRVTGERFVLGRAEGCDLQLYDDNVSRRHAELRELPEGRALLRDLGSVNGTYVDGRRVTEVELDGGEQIQIGDTVIEASVDQPEADRATAIGMRSGRSDSALRRAIRSDSVVRAALEAPRRARRTALLAALVGVAATIAVLYATGLLGRTQRSAADVVEEVAPATALVETLDADGNRTSTGTGFVLDAGRGVVVTNAHVVNQGARFRVALAGRSRPATILASAPCEDLALLRVRDRAGLQAIELGRQSELRRDQTVVAIGYPGNAALRDELTSTEGVVSVVRTTYREGTPDVPRYPYVVQTDEAINPGNSGGPLVDLDGRLIGVNAAGRTVGPDGRPIQGQGYAIGVDRVRTVVAGLREGRSIGWSGAGFAYPTAETLADQGLPLGVRVAHVVAGTDIERKLPEAARDYIVEVDGRSVDNTLAGWCDVAGTIRSGQRVRLGVIAAGADRMRTVTVRFP